MPRAWARKTILRTPIGFALALLLALRLLSPVGFMPAFDRGAVTIVACPDFGVVAVAGAHHHSRGKKAHGHQQCPFTAASPAATFGDPVFLAAAAVPFGTVALFGRAYLFLERHRNGDRPPTRGPPILV